MQGGEGGRDDGSLDGHVEAPSRGQIGRDRADERVARTHRVDGHDGRGEALDGGATGTDDDRSGRPDGDHDGLANPGPVAAGLEETGGQPFRCGSRVRRSTRPEAIGRRDLAELAAVRDEDVGRPNSGRSMPAAGRRAEDGPRAGRPCGGEGRPNGPRRDLVDDEDDIARPDRDPPESGRHGLGRESCVRAGRDGDHVLAAAVDQDQGDARGTGHDRELGQVDPLVGQRRSRVRSERVVADRTHDRNPGTEPGGRDGLVAAFAARMPVERGVAYGLAGDREVIDPRDEIDVDRADDDHPTR